jgi:hypothetical protein
MTIQDSIEGSQGNASCVQALQDISLNPNLHFQMVPGTDHYGVLGPVNELLAEKIIGDTEPDCNIKLSRNELRSLFNQNKPD